MPAPAALGILATLGKLGTKLLGPKAATALAGRLGGQLGVKQLAKEAALSGAINFGLGAVMDLKQGQPIDVGRNLGFAVTDALTSGAAQGGLRALRKGKRTISVDPKTGNKVVDKVAGEGLANLGASFFITPEIFNALGGNKQQTAPPQYLTDETLKMLSSSAPTNATSSIDAQQIQRALVNKDLNLLAGAYMPYTNFQDLGLPSEQAQMTQYFNDLAAAPVAVDPNMAKNAAAILGL